MIPRVMEGKDPEGDEAIVLCLGPLRLRITRRTGAWWRTPLLAMTACAAVSRGPNVSLVLL